jgi:hypothetical protein
MKLWLVAGGVILSLYVGGMLRRYGTVAPCGALKQELRAQVAAAHLEREKTTTNTALERLGTELGRALAGSMIESEVNGLTTRQCIWGVYHMAVKKEDFTRSVVKK